MKDQIKSWIKKSIIGFVVGLGIAFAIYCMFHINFGRLWLLPMAGFVLPLLLSWSKGNQLKTTVAKVVSVVSIVAILLFYAYDISARCLYPYYIATFITGQGHRDNVAVAGDNLQADKTEKALSKYTLGTDSAVANGDKLLDSAYVESVAAKVELGSKNLLRLKKSFGYAEEAIKADPASLVSKTNNANTNSGSSSNSGAYAVEAPSLSAAFDGVLARLRKEGYKIATMQMLSKGQGMSQLIDSRYCGPMGSVLVKVISSKPSWLSKYDSGDQFVHISDFEDKISRNDKVVPFVVFGQAEVDSTTIYVLFKQI